MKAVVYKGPYEVSVEDVPDAKIERPTDVLVRITATNICGSDLHMYEGRTDFEVGRTFGHENMGESSMSATAWTKLRSAIGSCFRLIFPVGSARIASGVLLTIA